MFLVRVLHPAPRGFKSKVHAHNKLNLHLTQGLEAA